MNGLVPLTTLAECEAVIERSFVDAGMAIRAIRDQQLYKDGWSSFEDYCQERWGWGRTRAYRMIEAAETVEALLPMGNTPLPANERQARELSGLPPEQAAEVMREAHAAPEPVTARTIADTRDRIANLPTMREVRQQRAPRTDVVAVVNTALVKARDAAHAAQNIRPEHLADRKNEAAVWSRDLAESLETLQGLLDALRKASS